jgi:putative transposase
VSARRLRIEHLGRATRGADAAALLVPSYLAASLGGAPLAVIRHYIAQQRQPALSQHH